MERIVFLGAIALILAGCSPAESPDSRSADPSRPTRSVSTAARGVATSPAPARIDRLAGRVLRRAEPASVAKAAGGATLRFPTRVALAPDGSVVVSDARAGAVFVHAPDGSVRTAIEGLDSPLGVAVGRDGTIFVGVHGRHAVEVYGPDGVWQDVIGPGTIEMPNDLALDRKGRLYVADSAAAVVRIYGADRARGPVIRAAGPRGRQTLRFPSSVAVSDGSGGRDGGELFVADQGRGRVLVYGLDGTWRRGFGGRVEAFSDAWQGRFVRLQSLAVAPGGVVLAADAATGTVQALDAGSGAFLGSLPEQDADRFGLPLDIVRRTDGALVVADARSGVLVTVPRTRVSAADGRRP